MEKNMNKKIFLMLLTCFVYSTYAMEESPIYPGPMDEPLPAQPDTPEQRLINAIRNDDIDGVRNAIAQGVNTRDPLPMNPYNPDELESPISYAVRTDKQIQIADLLFENGVNQADLNTLLRNVAHAGATDRMLWLLAHGAKDTNNEVRNIILNRISSANPPYTPPAARYQEALELLEQDIQPKQKIE